MNSVLNPEAPEFHPLLTSAVQNGYMSANKTIRTVNTFPFGYSYELFKTYPDFNIVTCKIRENVVLQSNQIMHKEVSSKLKRDVWSEEENTEKLIDANDSLLDRININIDTLTGVNKPSELFIDGVSAAWNKTPVIATIKVGSAAFIGAKNIPRPQISFKDNIDNSETLWVPKISDKPNNIKPLALNILYSEEGQPVGYEHPYKIELELYEPPQFALEVDDGEDPFPPPLDQTPLTFVDTLDKLDQLVQHLDTVHEIAVDLEHHSYRTYQGITCLIQITTNEGGDFIIDALAIREHIHKLNLSFTNPNKIKVFHGAESDILWLQRDFGVYVVGLFDSHQAARLLQLPVLSLKHLLMRYCHVDADKKYQLADWRIRPLPEELVNYARMDTHYLVYIWQQMKRELATHARPALLRTCFDNSTRICLATYNKDSLTETSHMPLYVKSKKSFNSRQMAALKTLYRWRDQQARELDESTTYLLPNHMLLSLAESLPREMQGVLACCSPTPPFVKQHVLTLHRIILSCRELPDEPQLYQMPASLLGMVPQQHNNSGVVHDISHIPEYNDEHVNLEIAFAFVDAYNNTRSEVVLFDPIKERTDDNNETEVYEETEVAKETKVTDTVLPGGVVSDLNAEAQMFVPPYDRYRMYRAIRQVEEIKDIKEKEAKVTAISKGNELIREEVLVKLQRAQASAPKPEAAADPDADDGPPPPEPDDKQEDKHEDDDSKQTKTSQRKRKMDKSEQREAVVTPRPEVPEQKRPETTVKPFHYKSANYSRFHSGPLHEHKQPKTKFKKC